MITAGNRRECVSVSLERVRESVSVGVSLERVRGSESVGVSVSLERVRESESVGRESIRYPRTYLNTHSLTRTVSDSLSAEFEP
jgi:hypothetical protein